MDDRAADTLSRSESFGGLVAFSGAVGPGLTAQMRQEADDLLLAGRLRSDGQEAVGRFDVLRMLDVAELREGGAPGLTYGWSLMCGLCAEINARGRAGDPTLEPGPVQLACFDGGGAGYSVHRDHSDFGVLPFLGDGLPTDPAERIVARRRVTAILYLQDGPWSPAWGGAFRAHEGTVFQVLDRQASGREVLASSFADCPPEGGTLVMFRSRDLAHEVLPTSHRRFALTMWMLQSDP